MLSQVHFPQKLDPEALDSYLAEGWFRMGQTIFTTNFLNFKNQCYSALWLRIDLNRIKPEKKFIKLQKLNSKFSVEITNATITAEKEELFARYRSQVSFEASLSLHQLLLGSATHNIYNSYEITVRDDDRLIACGFFDVGLAAVAGITSFYDPAYKKYSLGKYLIYSKVNHCQSIGIRYFYPGYFVPGYSHFDYKLKIYFHALEYYELSTKTWCRIEKFSSAGIPINVIREKLLSLKEELNRNEGRFELVYYEYFDASLVHALSQMELFDQPMFIISVREVAETLNSVVYFDVRDNFYHWAFVENIWSSGTTEITDDRYSGNLFRIESENFKTRSIQEMAAAVGHVIKYTNS